MAVSATTVVAFALAAATSVLLAGPDNIIDALILPHPCSQNPVIIPEDLLPKPAPLEGVFAPNEVLKKAERLFDGRIDSSESVVFAPDGSLIMLDKFGNVWQAARADGGSEQFRLRPKPLTRLGLGRPLGFHADKDGNLIVCNAGVGLQKVEKDTHKISLLTGRGPEPDGNITDIAYANDLDIAPDGTIYFTDSQWFGPTMGSGGFYDTLTACILGILQGAPTGRLLKYSPKTQTTKLVAGGLLYANGVALSADGDFAAVVETGAWRVHRQWLTGPKAGTRDILTDSLPGFPDGVSLSLDGKSFWVAVVMPSNILMKTLHSRWLRLIAAWIPSRLRPPAKRWGCVVQVSTEGQVLRMLMDSDGSHVAATAAVLETEKYLYFGNLAGTYVSRLDKALLPPVHSQ